MVLMGERTTWHCRHEHNDGTIQVIRAQIKKTPSLVDGV